MMRFNSLSLSLTINVIIVFFLAYLAGMTVVQVVNQRLKEISIKIPSITVMTSPAPFTNQAGGGSSTNSISNSICPGDLESRLKYNEKRYQTNQQNAQSTQNALKAHSTQIGDDLLALYETSLLEMQNQPYKLTSLDQENLRIIKRGGKLKQHDIPTGTINLLSARKKYLLMVPDALKTPVKETLIYTPYEAPSVSGAPLNHSSLRSRTLGSGGQN